MKLSQFARLQGISYRTAWDHFHAGKIKGAYQLPTGTIVVPDPVKCVICPHCNGLVRVDTPDD